MAIKFIQPHSLPINRHGSSRRQKFLHLQKAEEKRWSIRRISVVCDGDVLAHHNGTTNTHTPYTIHPT